MFRSTGSAVRLALIATSALAGPLWSQQTPAPKPLVMSAENLMAGDERHRDAAARNGDPKALLPGDVVRYRLTFTNLRADSVRNVQFNDALPGGLRYVAASAAADRGDVAVEFSIDGGRTYSERPMVEEVVNSQKILRPAPPTLYTNVRWSVRGWVKPRGQITTEFKAELAAKPAAAGGER